MSKKLRDAVDVLLFIYVLKSIKRHNMEYAKQGFQTPNIPPTEMNFIHEECNALICCGIASWLYSVTYLRCTI